MVSVLMQDTTVGSYMYVHVYVAYILIYVTSCDGSYSTINLVMHVSCSWGVIRFGKKKIIEEENDIFFNNALY